VSDYIADNPKSDLPSNTTAHNLLKQHMARAFTYYMFRSLPMWYFGGPTQTSKDSDEWFGKGASFAACQKIVTPFVPKNNLGNDLKVYKPAEAPGGYTELWNLQQTVG
jgi:hypothetical protein